MKKNDVFGHYTNNAWRKTYRVMKLTVLFLLLGIFSVSAKGFAQGGTISLQMENASLESILQELKSHSDYTFVYSDQHIEDVTLNSFEVEDADLEEVMNECLEDTNLSYFVEDNVVVIFEKDPVFETEAAPEEKKVKGNVTDSNGIPLPGVSVIVKGTNIGVATDIDGNYEIKFEQADALIYSFVGMNSQEIKYTGQTKIDIVLSDDAKALSEVVVTGYSSISKERATGSFVKIDSEEMQKVHHVSVEEKLQASSPGVLLSKKAGDGGEEVVIQMRGRATIKGSVEPLIVIDGFPVETRLSDLNTNDIESINILQDAAASSIWGAKAANGVIVVTTKRGKTGVKPQVEFSYNTHIIPAPRLKDLQLASSEVLIDSYVDYAKKYHDYDINNYVNGGEQYLKPVSQIIADHIKDPVNFTEGQMWEQLQKYKDTNNNKQYEDLFLRTGHTTETNLSVRGGNDFADYFLSYGYRNTKSTAVGDKSDRHNITINNNFNLHKKLRLSTGVNVMFDNKTNNGHGLNQKSGRWTSCPQYYNLVDENGEPIDYRIEMGTEEQMQEWEAKGLTPMYYNLIDGMHLNDNTTKRLSLRINAKLQYEIAKGLKLETSAMYQKSDNENRIYNSEYSSAAISMYNGYANITDSPNGSSKIFYNIPKGGILKLNNNDLTSYTFRNMLDFDKSIGKHQIKALAGFELRETRSKIRNRMEAGYNEDLVAWNLVDFYQLNQGVETITGIRTYDFNNFGDEDRERFASYFTNGSYTYDNKYTFSYSARIDDGSMFGVETNKRRTPLWSVGASWLISREDFFNVSYLDFLKLRLTYGKNGNVNNSFSSVTILAQSGGYNWDTALPEAKIKNYANPDLKWETTATTNMAVDFGLFDSRVTGTLELYKKKTSDVLVPHLTNSFQGTGTMITNAGTIENKGFTLQIQGRIGNKFQWIPGFNLSYNKNKVTEALDIAEDFWGFMNNLNNGEVPEGYSSTTIWGYKGAGLDANGEPMVYDKDGNITDISGPALDASHLRPIGDELPQYWGAFTNSFRYKNFALHTVIGYKFDYMVHKPEALGENVTGGVAHKSIGDAWKKPGDELHTNIPVVPSMYDYNSARNQYSYAWDLDYMKGDHIRLQDISLTYDIKTIKGFNNIQLRAQVSEVGLLWKANDLDLDPDYVPFTSKNRITPSSGKQLVSRPAGRPRPIWSFGVKVNF
jgi:TonB-linked SusC/RagA family outer membrane protein